jgi:cytochrome c oxidase assembly protein subunit 15
VTALIAARDPAGGLRRLATAASGLVLGQVVVGLANLVLLAPVALQLIHLLLADLLWLAVVVLASELRAHRSVASGPAAALRPLMPGPAG